MKIQSVLLVASLVGACLLAQSQEHNYKPPLGYVPDKETAVAIGRAVMIPVYGKAKIQAEEPITASLKNGVWIVEGSMPKAKTGQMLRGGVAEVRISKKTGEILRMTHGK